MYQPLINLCSFSGKVKTITVDKDDGIRPQTTADGLGKLRAVFKKGGSTTAGIDIFYFLNLYAWNTRNIYDLYQFYINKR